MGQIPSVLYLLILAAASYCLLLREGLCRSMAGRILALGLLFAAFALRYLCLDYETLDYQNFLTRWVDYFRQNGGFRALRDPVGNYNLPYLYFMALFSFTGYSDLHLIKLLSVTFDVVLAWGVLKTVSHFTPSPARRYAAF